MCVYKVMIYGILGRFINTKLTERPQNDIKLTIVMTIIHIFYPLVLLIHLDALQKQLIKLKK